MRGGRKKLKNEALQGCSEPQAGQTIMQVVSLRGSNLIEVMDSKGSKTLALFLAKFHKSLWIKRGSYVLVEGSDRERAMEAGSKVTCMIVQVLFDKNVRMLRKSHHWWPEGFNADKQHSVILKNDLQHEKEQENHRSEESSDDGLPPLEANCNRRGPEQFKQLSNEEASDSDS